MSLFAIFLASLIGSPHCMAMCGGFVAFYSGKAQASPITAHLGYHIGRLLAYTSLGAVAGLLGSSLDDVGLLIGVQHFSGILVGSLLIYWGSRGLLLGGSNFSLGSANSALFTTSKHFYHRILVRDESLAYWSIRAFSLGLLSALLPCGWLYAYVAVAATTKDALTGALVMAVFWLGTVPALITLGLLSRKLFDRYKLSVPKIIAILFIMAGVFSLTSHFGLLPHSQTHKQIHEMHKH